MRKTIFLFFLLSFGSVCNGQIRYSGQSIESILRQDESDIDLGLAVLVLAKEAYPNMDVNRFLDILNYMTEQIQFFEKKQGITEPVHRVSLMNTYLFKPGWWNDSTTFIYDISDLEGNKLTNRYLNGLLSSKMGSCVTLPMLYGVLSQRLGWPVYMVTSPKHYFCRYVDDSFEEQNIDATVWGGFISNQRYVEDAAIPDLPIKNGVYLRTLTNKEYIASLLVNQARFYQKDARIPSKTINRAIYLSNLALNYWKTGSSAHYNLSTYYLLWNRALLKQHEDSLVHWRNQANAEIDQNVRSGLYFMSANIPKIPFELERDTSKTLIEKYQLLGVELDTDQLKVDVAKIRQRTNSFVEHKELALRKQLENNLAKSNFHKAKADSLGIVLDFTDTFYRKQAESIEKLNPNH